MFFYLLLFHVKQWKNFNRIIKKNKNIIFLFYHFPTFTSPKFLFSVMQLQMTVVRVTWADVGICACGAHFLFTAKFFYCNFLVNKSTFYHA